MPLSDFMWRALQRLSLIDLSHEDVSSFAGEVADVPELERNKTDLHRLFYKNDGPIVHKWRHYLDHYETHLSVFRTRRNPVRLLEIGVSRGGSLHLWRKYFGEGAVIFGIDINQQCAALDGRDGKVRIGSQSDPLFLERIVREIGGLDVVIDDGSHRASHQKIAFETLFPHLSPNGVYICEDLHTSYWRGEEGGYRRPSSFIEIAKALIDDMHADFHRHDQTLPNANRTIEGIHFYNSMIVIQKRPQERPMHVMLGPK